MKSLKITILSGLLATCGMSQVIQDFSAVIDPNTFFYGSWEASGAAGTLSPNASFVQGAGVYDITGATATNSDLAKIEFFFSPVAFSIGSNGYLQVSAQALSLNAATSFQVVLLDSGSVAATSTFNASDFLTGTYSTAFAQLTPGIGFMANSIDSMIITGGLPSGTARFNFSFNEIKAVASAIPEPSTYAALAGALVLGLAALRRRKVQQA